MEAIAGNVLTTKMSASERSAGISSSRIDGNNLRLIELLDFVLTMRQIITSSGTSSASWIHFGRAMNDDIRDSADQTKYRVFISYSHEDADIAAKVAGFLDKHKRVIAVCDRDFVYGHGFHDQIKNFIAHAHIFMPIISANPSQRGWVHQEIGFALAQQIPIVPVCLTSKRGREPGLAKDPGEFLAYHQAIKLPAEVTKSCVEQFCEERFVELVTSHSDLTQATFRYSWFREERAEMLCEYCRNAFRIEQALTRKPIPSVLRQYGGLSTFQIPNRAICDPLWKLRYQRPSGYEYIDSRDQFGFVHEEATAYHSELQRRERLTLEAIALRGGCRLIINPYKRYPEFTGNAIEARIRCLVEFLELLLKSKVPVRIAFHDDRESERNLTIVGNWFAAHSVSMKGARQTCFTTHAPSIETQIAQFDAEVEDRLMQAHTDPRNSLRVAIGILKKRIKRLGKIGSQPAVT